MTNLLKNIDFEKLKYRLKYRLKERNKSEKDRNIPIKKTIRICNHRFNDNTIILGCKGSDKARSFIIPDDCYFRVCVDGLDFGMIKYDSPFTEAEKNKIAGCQLVNELKVYATILNLKLVEINSED